MGRELIKGDRDKIRLVGLYARGRHPLFSAVANDGRCCLKKGKRQDNRVVKKIAASSYSKALLLAEKWVRELRRQWEQEYGGSGPMK